MNNDVEVWHRVSINPHIDVGFKEVLHERHVRYKVAPLLGGQTLISFDIAESDPNWPEVAQLIQITGAANMFDTIFTPEEIMAAPWSRLYPACERGYPQPEKDMAWRQVVYDGYCPKCGVGYRQKAPFRFSKEPKLGRNDFMSLYWTWTVFCVSRVIARLQEERITGFDVWPPIIHHTGQPSVVISQLVFQTVAKPGLAEEDSVQPETCPECGITKYLYHKRGHMRLKRESLQAGVDVQQTHEWFGSGGHGGFRETLVSNKFARLIVESGWRGVRLKPIMPF